MKSIMGTLIVVLIGRQSSYFLSLILTHTVLEVLIVTVIVKHLVEVSPSVD